MERMERMKQLSISITQAQYALVMEWADRSGMSVAQVIRGLIAREGARLVGPPASDREWTVGAR